MATKSKTHSTAASNKKPSTHITKITQKPPSEEKVKITKASSIAKPKLSQPSTTKSQPLRAVAKPQPSKAETSTKARPQPLRAKHTISVASQPKAQQNSGSKQNVMSTIHNVTVSSPPPVKREILNASEVTNPRERTKTRTLNPDEIVILKQHISSGSRIIDSTVDRSKLAEPSDRHIGQDSPMLDTKKEPVAFEISFDESKQIDKRKAVGMSKEQESSRIQTVTKKIETVETLNTPELDVQNYTQKDDHEDPDYEDDFESYESDFETGSSSSETPNQTEESSEDDSPALSEPDESSEASEETQLPITVIHKEDERKLDSGSYEMNSRRLLLQQHQQQLDSIDTSTLNSEHLDSGISYSAPNSSLARPFVEPKSEIFSPKISKRGLELMSKIQLDEVTFVFFDLKPINYEHYMKLYGNYNGVQMSTQTNDDYLETGIQTDALMTKTLWTQHPPQFDLKFMRENDYRNLQNACGEFDSNSTQTEISQDPLARSLSAMSRFHSARNRPTSRTSEIDFVKLNNFLRRTEFTLASVLNKPTVRRSLKTSDIVITQGYYSLKSRFLSATKVKKMFTNSKSNLVIVIHDDVESVYSGDFRNLLSVWNVNEPKTPVKLLSTWSQVCCVEICAELEDIIVGGLDDGSVALWDLKESYSFGVQFGDGSCYFPPTQTITPYQETSELTLNDVGIVIAVKVFRSSQQLSRLHVYRPIQFASLHDSGIVTIWTLVNIDNDKWTSLRLNKIDNSKMEYNSPSARFKLNQSAIYNLYDYLNEKSSRPKSSFEKTRSYFENDLFNDSALRELQAAQTKNETDLVGLRFTGFDVGIERIYVSTNRDFIMSCTKTLKPEKFKKIVFENSKGLFATALKLLWNEEYLIVGFSNGSVIVYNCNPQKPTATDSHENSTDNSGCPTPMFESNRFSQNEIGKSCAIQNIVRNERTSVDDRPDSCVTYTRPTTAVGLSIMGMAKIFDKQILLGGTVLRKDLVNSIEVTSNGSRLLALTDGNLRIYDFTSNSEMDCSMNGNIREIGLTKETFGCQNLTVLTKDEDVQVHIIK